MKKVVTIAATMLIQPVYCKFRPKSLTDAKEIFRWPEICVAEVEDFQPGENNQHYSILILPHFLADPGFKGCFLNDFF